MKVDAISDKILKFKSNNISNTNAGFDPYLYVNKKDNSDKFSFKGHQLQYLGGFCALMAAAWAISKFITKNPTPRSVVELAKKSANGLNKIVGNENAVDVAKYDILFPLKSYNIAKNNFRRNRIKYNDMQTGLIIACKDAKKAKEFIEAFIEHAKEIKINVQEIEQSVQKNRIPLVYNVLDNATKYHEKSGKCSIAYIGNIAVNTKLKSNKTKPVTKLEKRLVNTKPGTLWVAWTAKPNDIPYFYNNSRTKYIILD